MCPQGRRPQVGRREETVKRLSRVSTALGDPVWVQEHQQQPGVEEVGSYRVKGCVGQRGHRAKEAETWHVSSL